MTSLCLRNTCFAARLGLTCLVLVLAGGYLVASYLHMKGHHENRDGRPGLTMDDVKGVYHGVTVASPMLGALNRDHPPEMPADERAILVRWLTGENVPGNYENPDFDAFTPRELIETNCLNCHRGEAAQGAGLSLSNWPEIQKVAFANEVFPMDVKILMMSMHAHASTMGVIGLVMCVLALMTRWPRGLVGLLIALAGLGLLVDIGSWFPARQSEMFTYLIPTGGLAHTASMGVLMLLVIADLWGPARHSGAANPG